MTETGQVVFSSGRSKTQIALAIVFLLLGAATFVKAAFFRGDVILYALGVILVISGIQRLRGKSA